MAIITAAASGNWMVSGTWGGAIPASGDQAIIPNGFTVNVNSGVVVGISPPGTPDGAASFAPTLFLLSGSAVTNLPTGGYRLVYTNVDASGHESSRSPETSITLFTQGTTKPQVVLPAVPAGVSSRNVYLTNTSGAVFTEHLYASPVSGTTQDLIASGWNNGTQTYAQASAFPDSSAVLLSGTGTLVINSGITLQCLGDLRAANAGVMGFADSVIEFDAEFSASPANSVYAYWNGVANGQVNALFSGVGVSGHNFVFRSNLSGAHAKLCVVYSVGAGGLTTDCGNYNAAFCTFLRLGTATVNGVELTQQSSSGTTCSFDHCTFDTCGQVNQNYSVPTGPSWSFTNNTWQNSLGTRCLNVGTAANPTGKRTLTGNFFDIPPRFTKDGLSGNNNVFMQGWLLGRSDNVKCLSFDGNFIRICSGGVTANQSLPGDITNAYLLVDVTSGTIVNPHFISPDTGFTSGTALLTDSCIADFNGGDPNGDFWLSPNNAIQATLTHNIVLPNASGDNTGTLFTIFDNVASGFHLTARHNTYFTGSQSAAINEHSSTGNGPPGSVSGFLSNIAWANKSGYGSNLGPFKICDSQYAGQPTSGTLDFVNPAGCGFNAGFNYRATFPGAPSGGYNINSSTPYNPTVSGDIGFGDVDGQNPNFVDNTRNFALWAVTQGSLSSGVIAQTVDGLTFLKANPSLTKTSLIPYIRSGFAPTNTALHNTAHDGTDIGAVPWQAASGGGGGGGAVPTTTRIVGLGCYVEGVGDLGPKKGGNQFVGYVH